MSTLIHPVDANSICTASIDPKLQSRIDRAEEQRTRLYCSCAHPVDQAHLIARHYLQMASLARDLLDLTRSYNSGCRDSATEYVIADLKRQIQQKHLQDFGIPLDWQTPPN